MVRAKSLKKTVAAIAAAAIFFSLFAGFAAAQGTDPAATVAAPAVALAAAPVAAEAAPGDASGTDPTVIYSQDFESFDASASEEDIFSDAAGNKPAGMDEFIGDGPNSGAIIVADKLGSGKSIRLMRADGGVANIRAMGISTRSFKDGSRLDFSFTFRYKVLGNYGFTAVLSGITASPNLDDYGGGTRNIFSANTDTSTGKDSLYVVNPDSSAGRILVTDELKADTDYVLTASFIVGSDEYEVLLNGASLGTYKYIGAMAGITGIRIDCHDWIAECDISRSQPGDVHVNEVYFDDISLTAIPAEDSADDPDAGLRFVDYEEFFAEDWEFLYSTEDFEKPSEDSDLFGYVETLPHLKSEKTPFVNPNTYLKILGGSEAIDSISVAFRDFADIRFWSLSQLLDDGDAVRVSLDVNAKNISAGGYFDLCVTNLFETEDGPTFSTGQGGMVFRLVRSPDGKIDVVNSNYQLITTFEPGETHRIGVVFQTYSDKYVFFLDDNFIADSYSVYPGEFEGISSLRFDLDGAGSEVALDNIYIESGLLKEKAAPVEPTDAPATDVPASEAPATEVPATQTAAVTEMATATDVPDNASAEPTAAPASDSNSNSDGGSGAESKDNKGGLPAGAIIGIIAGAAVVVAAAVVAVVLAKKKKAK